MSSVEGRSTRVGQVPCVEGGVYASGGPARDAARDAAQVLNVAGQSVLIAGPALGTLHARVQRAAPTDIPVLIQGETGTGKEWLAHAIHHASPRSSRPLEILNCGAIPDALVEATLFGAERGAFTGAVRTRAGVFERADGGTVFLDELGELSLEAQASLLRVLDGQPFHRVGGQVPIRPDVRLVAATNRDLQAEVAAGNFRMDLLYRLSTVTFEVLPLRARREEIGPLAEHFLRIACKRWGRGPERISDEVIEHLAQQPWPGNVRQLRAVVEAAALGCDGDQLLLHDLPPPPAHARLSNAIQLPSVPDETPVTQDVVDLRAQVRELEARLIRAALEKTGGRQREAALLLGLPLRTLVYKLGRLGIRRLAC